MPILTRVRRYVVGLAIVLQFAPGASLACTSNLVPQASAIPALSGRLVFQAGFLPQTYDTARNPIYHLYYYDFRQSAAAVELDANWNLHSVFNPNIGRNGQWIVFTATSSACSDSSGYYYQIYIYKIGSTTAPTPLVSCDDTSREDIKFSSDMGSVIYKHRASQYSLETMPLTFNADGSVTLGAVNILVSDATERSAPSLSPTGKYVYYYEGDGKTATTPAIVFQRLVGATASDAETAITSASGGVNDYYPVSRDYSVIFYVQNSSLSATAPDANDQLYMQFHAFNAVGHESEVSFNDCSFNNQDPAPGDEDYLLFSRPAYNGSGGNDQLFVGQLGTTRIWSLAPLLTPNGSPAISNLLGSSYWSRTAGKAP